MNERIQELYMQAIEYTDSVVPAERRYNDIYYAIASAKHAKLIVKECMDLALSEQKRYAKFTHRDMSECAVTMSNFRLVMKDHFGVEE